MFSRIIKLGLVLILLSAPVLVFNGCSKTEKVDAVAELFKEAQEMQQAQKYEDAVRIYRKIIRDHPDSDKCPNSQFMIGYIYANHINDYEQAKIELERFLEKYEATSDSGLVVGAKFELQWLGKSIEEIPVLANLNEKDSTGAVTDTSQGK